MKCLSQKMQAVKAINLKPSVIDAKTLQKKIKSFCKKNKIFSSKKQKIRTIDKKIRKLTSVITPGIFFQPGNFQSIAPLRNTTYNFADWLCTTVEK